MSGLSSQEFQLQWEGDAGYRWEQVKFGPTCILYLRVHRQFGNPPHSDLYAVYFEETRPLSLPLMTPQDNAKD